jgi:hypothetical protein
MSLNEIPASRQHASTGPTQPQLPEPSHAERVRTLVTLASVATLSTLSRVLRYWGQALKRRSQIRRYAWVRRLKLAAQWLPQPRVLHPWPLDRFAATHPR